MKLYAPKLEFVNAHPRKNTPRCKNKIHIDESMGMEGSAPLPSVWLRRCWRAVSLPCGLSGVLTY